LLRFLNSFAKTPGKEQESEVSNEKKEIKVTDKRMFTPDGELREEYRVLAEKSTVPTAAAAATAPAPEPAPAARPAPEPPPAASAHVELPEMPPELGGPSFFDLVAMLAEPVPIYLGDAVLPDGQDATNLEMARFYIDLLAVLRQKTAGNVTAQESAFLEDLLYRMRVRYVQKSG
jgi:Domain of unknown function (DUF1844)